jgi:predicted DNA-binding transcriptional regulator YafY
MDNKVIKWRKFFGTSIDKLEDELKKKKAATHNNEDEVVVSKNASVVAQDDKQIREAIKEGIREKRGLDIAYVDSNNEKTERRIMPLSLDGYKLRAYCELRHEERTFLLNRIVWVKMETQISK